MSWLAVTRWWLLALPVAFALAVVGMAYRVEMFWWGNGYHQETQVAKPGETITVTQEFDDVVGETTRTYKVRAVGLERLEKITWAYAIEESPPPPGMVAWEVRLDWEAAPDQDLNACKVWLLDEDGNLYGGDTSTVSQPTYPCAPKGAEGPMTPLFEGDKRGKIEEGDQPRPPTWSTAPVVLAKEGARITEVRIAFEYNDYVTLRLEDAS